MGRSARSRPIPRRKGRCNLAENGRTIAREMVGILETYRHATGTMTNALLRADDAGVDAALAARSECIVRYSAEVARWTAIPNAERDPSLIELIHRHHLCIACADRVLLQRIESLKSEVGEAIARVGKVGKMQRSYLPPASAQERIVNGEG